MQVYETVFMVRQDLSETQVKQLTDKYTKVLTDNKAKILKTEQWGLRALAYTIRKSRRAHYVLIESQAPGAAVIELERLLRLDEDVLRSLTVKRDEPSTEPSAPLGRSGSSSSADKEAA